jgi:predicted alpha-1,2-mannosidase
MKHRKFILLIMSALISTASSQNKPVDYVDPIIGTGGHGHTFPGATLPFGMVQLSPDTDIEGWDWCSGYHYSDNSIMGFSHTHLSGTGASDYGDILFMPITGKLQLQPGSKQNPDDGYRSFFDHKDEIAEAGYYSVLLKDYNIKAELTSTERTGFQKYSFPESDSAYIIIDLEHGIHDRCVESKIVFVSDTVIEGYRRSTGWANDHTVYFSAKFSKPFQKHGVCDSEGLRENEKIASGRNIKGYVAYSTEDKETILVKVGISHVSIDGARRNLRAEIEGWDFEKVRFEARQKWNSELSRIEVEGKSEEAKKIFYTGLYHCMIAPNIFNDVDGKYPGSDKKIHTAEGFQFYTVFSLWDTFRAFHPLFTIIDEKRTADWVKTLLLKYDQSGLLPVWELAANETWTMIGYPSIPVIVDAFIKGIYKSEPNKVLMAMIKSANRDQFGLPYYKKQGFIPANKEHESVSKTLEYAYEDWCISEFARMIGDEKVYGEFSKRSQFYLNLFDRSTGFMRAKRNGSWIKHFDPFSVSGDYTEANAWQYSFFVPQNIPSLLQLMNGKNEFIKKLDELFSVTPVLKGRFQPDISGMIGQYAHGNEPSHHVAYLYNYAESGWKTQQKVRQIMSELYSAKPDGLCGNDDCGQLSAWFVFSAMGFYPVTPGLPFYSVGSPIFDEIKINLENGKKFIIKTINNSENNLFISSAVLNGKYFDKLFLDHSLIKTGGELTFEMNSVPADNWGKINEGLAEILKPEVELTPVPVIIGDHMSFYEPQLIKIISEEKNSKIYFTTDGTEPDDNSYLYKTPFEISDTRKIKAINFQKGYLNSMPVEADFTKIPFKRSIEIKNQFSESYSAGGQNALIDFIRGTSSYNTGLWQGYEKQDLDVIIDLGSVQSINHISSGYLQDIGVWIFFPEKVSYFLSEDGVDFKLAAEIKNDFPQDQQGAYIKEFSKDFTNLKARYVRVLAKNVGICPSWHKGAGYDCWLFADEIVIE